MCRNVRHLTPFMMQTPIRVCFRDIRDAIIKTATVTWSSKSSRYRAATDFTSVIRNVLFKTWQRTWFLNCQLGLIRNISYTLRMAVSADLPCRSHVPGRTHAMFFFSSGPITSRVGVAQSVWRWATSWTIGVQGFDSQRGLGIFFLTTPSSLLSSGYQGLFPWG
jgi:hypothetical protein